MSALSKQWDTLRTGKLVETTLRLLDLDQFPLSGLQDSLLDSGLCEERGGKTLQYHADTADTFLNHTRGNQSPQGAPAPGKQMGSPRGRLSSLFALFGHFL